MYMDTEIIIMKICNSSYACVLFGMIYNLFKLHINLKKKIANLRHLLKFRLHYTFKKNGGHQSHHNYEKQYRHTLIKFVLESVSRFQFERIDHVISIKVQP